MEDGVVDGSEGATFDNFSGFDGVTVVHHHVIDGDAEVLLFGEGDDFFGFSDCDCHWLFENDVFAGVESCFCDWAVGGIVGGDEDGVDVWIAEDFFLGVVPFETEGLDFGLVRGAAGGDTDKFAGLVRLEALCVASEAFWGDALLGDTTEADDGVANFAGH